MANTITLQLYPQHANLRAAAVLAAAQDLVEGYGAGTIAVSDDDGEEDQTIVGFFTTVTDSKLVNGTWDVLRVYLPDCPLTSFEQAAAVQKIAEQLTKYPKALTANISAFGHPIGGWVLTLAEEITA